MVQASITKATVSLLSDVIYITLSWAIIVCFFCVVRSRNFDQYRTITNPNYQIKLSLVNTRDHQDIFTDHMVVDIFTDHMVVVSPP